MPDPEPNSIITTEPKMRVLLDGVDVTYSLSTQMALQAAGIRFKSGKNRGVYPNEMILVEEADYPRAVEALRSVSHTDESMSPAMRYGAWAFIGLFIAGAIVMVVRALLG
jgi:hypothetical protein